MSRTGKEEDAYISAVQEQAKIFTDAFVRNFEKYLEATDYELLEFQKDVSVSYSLNIISFVLSTVCKDYVDINILKIQDELLKIGLYIQKQHDEEEAEKKTS